MRRTKIVATIGPATCSPEALGRLVGLGVDVFRLNFSHGTRDEHRARIRAIRERCRESGRDAAILQDLCGPKIRVGEMKGGGAVLVDGAEVTITTRAVAGTAACFSTSYEALARDVREGGRVMLDDGLLELEVLRAEDDRVSCRVVRGGLLTSRKGINLPGTAVSSPSVTAKDMGDLLVGIEEGVDFVALSFVREPGDIEPVRAALRAHGSSAQVISKIEKPEAIEHLDAIVSASDGLLVARGDLGVEMDLASVAILQKDMVRRANEQDKYVIVATQMLDSMIRNPVPTRAEVSDVSNAILDGADAVMLSGETAVGAYPAEAVRMLVRVAARVEAYAASHRPPWDWTRNNPVNPVQDAIAMAAFDLCRDLKAAAIVAYSATGGTALFLSRNRPTAPVVAFTADPHAFRRMHLFCGVSPVLDPSVRSREGLLRAARATLLERGLASSGQLIVVVAGALFGQVGSTNGVEVAVLE